MGKRLTSELAKRLSGGTAVKEELPSSRQPLSDGGHRSRCQALPSVGFLRNPVESVGPLDGLRGPVPQGDSTLAAAPVPVLGQRGASGGAPGGPRAAAVLRAVGDFLRRRARR